MGIVFSRLRDYITKATNILMKPILWLKKKTSAELLESLEKDIKLVEEDRLKAEQRQRKIVGYIIGFVALYVLVTLLFYFFFFPATLWDQLWYIVPLLSAPILIVLVVKIVNWYYRRRLLKNEEKLQDMKKQKKKILDEVMEKETYKVAKEILDKYASEQVRKPLSLPTSASATPQKVPSNIYNKSLPFSTLTEAELRRRATSQPLIPPNKALTGSEPSGTGFGSGRAQLTSIQSRQINGQELQLKTGYPRVPMPRPVFPRERTYVDKFVEYVLGDGPSNRYALICKQCESHNGMALREEFEYLGFRCCYCFYYNPARKERPHGPTISSPAKELDKTSPGHTSSSELNSSSDSEDNESENEAPIESQENPASSTDDNVASDTVNVEEQGTKEPECDTLKIEEVESGPTEELTPPSANDDTQLSSEVVTETSRETPPPS